MPSEPMTPASDDTDRAAHKERQGMTPPSDAQRYYDALRRIAREYETVESLERSAERKYGLPFVEVLEMAYDNIQQEAARAIFGKRRPKCAIRKGGNRPEPSAKASTNKEELPNGD